MTDETSRRRFDGRVAFITGAGSGIGRAAAVQLAREGARVALFDRDAATAAETLSQLGDPARAGAAYALDVADPDQVPAVLGRAAAEVGPADILVNSAGIRELTSFLNLGLEEWRRVLDVNLTGLFLCSQEVAKDMVGRNAPGSIVQIASVAGLAGFSERAAYVASKHGVIGLTKQMALELGPHGIRVNAVAPGPIETNLTKQIKGFSEVMDRTRAALPLRRLGSAGDVASLIAFLASDDAAFISGATFTIDGGLMARTAL